MAKKEKTNWKVQREREKEQLTQQLATVQPRPSQLIRVLHFTFVSFLGIIPSSYIVINLTKYTSLQETEWGGFVILGLMIFLWAFLGLTSDYWYKRKYRQYIEIKKKLENY